MLKLPVRPADSEERKDQGFTLIELLVVVLIIGVLAAIAIPVFLSQREKAADASVQSDLKNLGTVQGTYLVDNNAYANKMALLIADGYDFKKTGNNVIKLVSANADGFCATGTREGGTAGTDTFYYDSGEGGLTGVDCTAEYTAVAAADQG
ncbi:type IV pilus assembly protein PilA [Nocardioides salarius]|uniref:Type IV pilus assembly protein PilA n=1 Tax=Nocardioides salarius TaxID=374513 RepID=A0ABS2M8P6_9ACTN|nr:prepilin-type N-terminal cleavage/methylation domain-containing protein [Nocardioides salarius]MBM7507567.1 type IV pilus assembly protein PilA [Nocardioides salarius]